MVYFWITIIALLMVANIALRHQTQRIGVAYIGRLLTMGAMGAVVGCQQVGLTSAVVGVLLGVSLGWLVFKRAQEKTDTFNRIRAQGQHEAAPKSSESNTREG